MSETIVPQPVVISQPEFTHSELAIPNPHISEVKPGEERVISSATDSGKLELALLNNEAKRIKDGEDPRVMAMAGTVLRAAEFAREGITDGLTGLLNREGLEMWFARHAPEHMGIISADVIKFKKINDAHGQEYGDRVISYIGKVFASKLRTYEKPVENDERNIQTNPKDVVAVARWGGDEVIAIVNLDNVVSAEMLAQMRDDGESEDTISNFIESEREKTMKIIQNRLHDFGTYEDEETGENSEVKIRAVHKLAQKSDPITLEQHIKELNDGIVDTKATEK